MNEGEERLVCLFSDVHFWFSEPSARPTGHRFDKESYVYLYRHLKTSRGRLEIANHAGTPEQDAFTGYLDNAKISQSHRHPNLVTIVVDGVKSEHPIAPQSTEWRLPSTDPRDEGKYLFRLHTLDVYFWTKEDATTFVTHCQHTLHPNQLDLDYPVDEPHHDLASPVVQKLENMAVSDPAYSNNRHSTSTKVATPVPSEAEEKKVIDYTPLAYNPAAPPAPEKRTHREKTPPPPEEPGPGLGYAANDNSHRPYTGNPASPHPYSPSPTSHGVASPPPPTTSSSTALTSQSFSGGPPIKHHSSELPLESPTVQILGQSYLSASPVVPLQHIQPQYPDYLANHQSPSPLQQQQQHQQPPIGGYSKYSYSPQPSTSAPYNPNMYYSTSTGDTEIHSQVYRPTEEESHGKPAKPGVAGPGAPGPGKWEQKAEKAEKGLNRLLRKVEKKIG